MALKIPSFWKKNIFFTVIMNIIVTISMMLLFYARYGCELDIIMQSAIYGVTESGMNMGHIMFSNIILGKILALLSANIPSVAWYTVFHYGMVFVALIVITEIIVHYNPGLLGRALATVVSVFCGYECYIQPMYMKTSVMLTAAAVLLLWHQAQVEKHSFFYKIAAVISGLTAALVSYKVFLYAFFMGVIAIVLILIKQEQLQSKWKFLANSILILGVLAVLLHGMDNYAYQMNPIWNTAGEYRNAIEKAYALGLPEYEDIEDTVWFSEYADITSEKYEQIKTGTFIDYERMYQFLEVVSAQNVEFTAWKVILFFRTVPIQAFKTGMFYLWIIFIALMRYKNSITYMFEKVLISAIMIWIPYFVLYFWYGCENQWIGMLIYMPAVIYLLMDLKDINVKEPRYLMVYLGIFGLLLYYIFSDTMISSISTPKELRKAMEEQEENPTIIYDIDFIHYIQNFSIYERYPSQYNSHNRNITSSIFWLFPEFRTKKQSGELYSAEAQAAESNLYTSEDYYRQWFIPQYSGMKYFQIRLGAFSDNIDECMTSFEISLTDEDGKILKKEEIQLTNENNWGYFNFGVADIVEKGNLYSIVLRQTSGYTNASGSELISCKPYIILNGGVSENVDFYYGEQKMDYTMEVVYHYLTEED